MFRVYLLVMSVCLFIGQVWAVGEMSFQAESAPTVTLDMREVPLVKILQEIERQAGVSFSYESSLMKAYRKVSIQVENVPVEKCLEQLFVPLSIQYNRTGNIIVLIIACCKRHFVQLLVFAVYRSRPIDIVLCLAAHLVPIE